MDVKVVLSSDEIVRGLKHYRRIAKQDILRAPETPNPEAFRCHAEARRTIYARLTDVAEAQSPADVVLEALEYYKGLPFVTGTAEGRTHRHQGAGERFRELFSDDRPGTESAPRGAESAPFALFFVIVVCPELT